MSLNGLDDAAVTEAYTGALGEAGGWFLLKYASRDSVEILTRGTGGAHEARTAIAAYPDNSPLYGFLLYRRRKVLIKYVPEGTSRLLQARVAVHFTAVTDKFAPHDTTFSITTPDELSDAALTSACSLHTAAPSSSSSSLSSRKQKLDGITEDVEDAQSTAGASESPSTARPSTANTVTGNTPSPLPEKTAEKEVEKSASIDEDQAKADGEAAEKAPATADEITDRLELLRTPTAPDRDSFKKYDALFENGPDPRLSSQTTRPDLADLYAEIYAQYNKPKVKLGPRPKASLDMKRPSTSGAGTQSVTRPVSSLPPGLRSSNRKNVEPRRPKSRDASTVPSIAIPPPPPIPMAPEMPLSPMYHPKSPTSIRSLPMNTYSSLHGRSHGSSQEKQRLMKALQLRKKQMEARKVREEKDAEAAAEDTTAGAEEHVADEKAVDDPTLPADAPIEAHDEPETAKQLASENDEVTGALDQEEPKPEIPPTRADTDDIHSAASASSPTSAQTQGSSVAPSTRPSSISEDDVPPAKEIKEETVTELPVRPDEALADNESTSAESTPTVVPETTTPVPYLQVSRPSMDTTAGASEDTVFDDSGERKKKRESMVLVSASEIDEARARRKSKRASMMLPLSSESLFDTRNKTSLNEQPTAEGKENRRHVVDPSHLSAENSEAEYLSDDSFMEELQSAKVEEAMPMSVSKSPITPFFSRKPSSPEFSVPKRSASQHARLGGHSPEQPGLRKLSGPWVNHASTEPVVVAKKINVGSGISQRIKALAEKSNRDSTASLSPVITPDGVSSTVAQRKSSFFTTPPDGNSPTGKSVNRMSRASFINVSRSTTPEPKPAVHAPRAKTPTQPQTVYTMQQGSERPESVQVTARIVRDAQPQKPILTMPTETSPLELHRSAITIDHQKSTRPPTSSSKHSATRTEPTSPRPPSSSQSNEPVPNLPRSSSESSWRSFGRRHSESKNGGPPRSMSANSLVESSSDEKPAKKEKKDSRTSKLFKRMSSISSITRKNSAPSIPEDIPSIPLPSLREPPSAVQLGDLNIQFPDTLLWKRRWVEIDASGNLVLSQSKTTEQSKGGIMRRFSLMEFRAPFAPDLDQQELPNSVVLDFLDGRTLQLACETYSGQAQVLAILSEAHTAWTDYNQGL
ncbi:hypothetical protein DPSP01_012693 [Paraphaeosphaeria sporulosa]|uniref:ADF-H domain-containing protein n=1 Tax=Paraphaeosphaeria sporulosa TaxID=1460663 RepID=A0A177C6M3_9PLEO|nr:uncharacterized protein CC84DRAFT_1207915 [Paraphaeosphaeria sporulosa]OAG03185.1 hypothetical protein CC84DRAFT_1207915 [Paraphaeosphaeria sporulosa]